MLSAHSKNKLISLATFLENNKDTIAIDGDTHPSDLAQLKGDILRRYRESSGYYHGRPISPDDLLKEMAAAGVDMAVTWQNPAALQYTEDATHNFEILLRANQDIHDFSRTYENKFIAAGWTDPRALGVANAARLAEICVRDFGFPIVKMNPAQNSFPIDSEEVVLTINRIVELGATPALHFGGDTIFTPASGLKKLAMLHPHHPLIAVHMGGGGSHYVEGDKLYLETRELGLQHKNLFFILSAKRDCHIESALIQYTLAGPPFANNLAWGSDAPYGKVTWNFGGFECMLRSLELGHEHPDARIQQNPHLFTKEVIQAYRGRNLAELVISSCQCVLEKHGVAWEWADVLSRKGRRHELDAEAKP